MDYLAQLFKFQCTGYLQTDTGPLCTIADLFQFIRQLLNVAMLGLAPAIFIIVVAYGAYLIILSRGTEQVKQGRQVIWKAFLGLLVVLGAWVIVNTIFSLLGVNMDWSRLQ